MARKAPTAATPGNEISAIDQFGDDLAELMSTGSTKWVGRFDLWHQTSVPTLKRVRKWPVFWATSVPTWQRTERLRNETERLLKAWSN